LPKFGNFLKHHLAGNFLKVSRLMEIPRLGYGIEAQGRVREGDAKFVR
jgi:hypothetical protein